MRTFVAVTTALLAFSRAALADVWVADDRTVYKIDPTSWTISASIASPGTQALVVDPRDQSVWILSGDILYKRSSAGALILQATLASLGASGANQLLLDTHDGSLWLATGNKSSVVHVSSTGALLTSIATPSGTAQIALALDRTLWVLGQKILQHFTSSGTLLASIDTKSITNGEPKLVQVDSIGAWVWISAEKRLARFDASGSSSTILATLPGNPDQIFLDEISATAWAVAGGTLTPVDSGSATVGHTIDLGLKSIGAAVFDHASRSIILGHSAGATRLSETASNPALAATTRSVTSIGVAPFQLDTSLNLVSPTTGTVTNNARIPITLQLQALCSGSTCNFPGAFYHGYSIDAALNGQAIGSSITIDATTGRATFQTPSRLPEGLNAWTATATDSFGQRSNTVTGSFTVDTTPPVFVFLDPPSPSITNKLVAHVSGRLNEASTLFIGGSSTPVANDGTFGADVALVEGANMISLQATDLAGNGTSQALAITRDTVPPSFGTISPPDGSTLTTPTVTISGSVTEPSTITLGGTPGQVADGINFAFPVSLQPGLNIFTLTAVDRAGNQTSTTVRLTLLSGLSLSITSPANGATIVGSTAYVMGTVTGANNVGVSANGSVGTFVGNAFVAAVPLTAGINSIAVTATSQDGTVVSQTLTVTEGVPPPIELTIQPNAGIAPFNVTLSIPSIPNRISAQTNVDFDGDGVVDETAYGFNTTITYTYSTPGIYNATISLNDLSGGNYTWSVPVVVQDVRAVDARLKGLIGGMLAALRVGDIDGALRYFTPEVVPQYRAAFNQIGARLPDAVNNMGTIVDGQIADNFAEYVLIRGKPGGNQAYLIYLQLGLDGVWRISQM